MTSLFLSLPTNFIIFCPPVCKEWESSTVGAWQPAKFNTPATLLSSIIFRQTLSFLGKGCEFLCVWTEGPTGTVTTIWNLVAVINVQRQLWLHRCSCLKPLSLANTWKNKLQAAVGSVIIENSQDCSDKLLLPRDLMLIPYFSVVHGKYLWLTDLVPNYENNTRMRLAAADTTSCVWLQSHSVFAIPSTKQPGKTETC